MLDFADCPRDEMEMLRWMESIQLDREERFPYAEALGRDGRREKLLLLEELFELLARGSWRGTLELELKDEGLMPLLAPLLENSPFKGQVLLMSGVESIIEETQDFYRDTAPPEGVGLGANIRRLDDAWRCRIESMRLFEVGLNAWCFGKEEVEFLKERNIQIFSNLGDTPEWWAELHNLGAAAFKTNYQEEYTRWWREYNNE